MNLTPFYTQLFAAMHWLIPALIVIAVLRSPWFKGHLGEGWVRLVAGARLDQKVYRRLHNVTLATASGSTQIDHVIVSPFGIFVLETKNYRGWIFGSEFDRQWTQQIYRSRHRFLNPLRQNFKHQKALQQMLGIPPQSIHSVICFVGDSSFRTPMPPNVTQGTGWVHYIKSFQQPVFSPSQVDQLMQTLQSGRLPPGLATQRQHVRSLRDRHAAGPNPSSAPSCPYCAKPMLVRTARRQPATGSTFWGCPDFPRCRGTRPR